MQPLWSFEAVEVRGSHGPRLVCDGLAIGCGITAVMGESGAGKSTLLNLLVGFVRPDGGRLCAAPPTAAQALPLFWAPQNDGLWPHLTVRGHLSAVRGGEDPPRAEDVLRALDLLALAERGVEALSVGEQSRLSTARAMCAQAAVTVLDEPLAHVDRVRRHRYWAWVVDGVRGRGGSMVYATHSPRMVLGYAERVILLREGRVLAEGAVRQLYWHPGSPEVAAVLGDANWVTAADADAWLPGSSGTRNYRPSELRLVAAGVEAPLRLEALHFRGEVTEALLRHVPSGRQRAFLLLSGSMPAAGDAVRLLPQPRDAGEGAS